MLIKINDHQVKESIVVDRIIDTRAVIKRNDAIDVQIAALQAEKNANNVILGNAGTVGIDITAITAALHPVKPEPPIKPMPISPGKKAV